MSNTVSSLLEDVGAWTQTSLDRSVDTLDPLFVPELGSPLSKKEGWWSPTGNFNGGTWGQGLVENGMSEGTLGLNSDVQAIGDQVAPKIASYYFGPWMNSTLSGFINSGTSPGNWSSFQGGYDSGSYGVTDGMSAPDLASITGNVGASATTQIDPYTSIDSFNQAATSTPIFMGTANSVSDLSNVANPSYNDYWSGTGADAGSLYQSQASDLASLNATTGETGLAETLSPSVSGETAGEVITPNINSSTGGTGSMWEDAVNSGYGKEATFNYNPSAQNPSLWDSLTSNLGYGLEKAVMNAQQNITDPKKLLNMVGSLGTMYSNYKNKEALANAADPFGSQRAQYQNLLSQSYTDPTSVYNGANYQALQNIFNKQLAAKDAAAGRNSQYASRATQAQTYFQQYLDSYRKQLAAQAGASIAPNANLSIANAQANKNILGGLGSGLTSLFG